MSRPPVSTPARERPRRQLPRWLRGIRRRLAATYLLAAAVLAVVGAGLLINTLDHGLRDSIDSGLRAQAAVQIADLSATVGEGQHPTPALAAPGSAGYRVALAGGLDGFTATISPHGRLVEAQPSPLPRGALAGYRVGRPPPAPTFRTVTVGDRPLRVLVVPVHRPSGTWTVVTGAGLSAAQDVSTEIAKVLWIATPIVVAIIGLGAWLLSGAALRPVDRMRADAQKIGEQDPAGRLREPGTGDSLDALARTFNGLLGRLHRSLGRQRALVADAGHELRTPLAVLRMELDTALRPGRSREDLIDSIEHAQVEVARLAALAENLLLLAQADEGRQLIAPELTDLTEVVAAAERGLTGQARRQGVQLATEIPEHLVAQVDPRAVRRILDNLMGNALRHTPPGGTVTVRADVADAVAGMVRLTVTDSGPGFPAEFLPLAFERFARADGARSRAATYSSSGLGLSIVATLADAHGGSARAANRPEGGASVEVLLPVDGPAESQPPGAASSAAGAPGIAR